MEKENGQEKRGRRQNEKRERQWNDKGVRDQEKEIERAFVCPADFLFPKPSPAPIQPSTFPFTHTVSFRLGLHIQ